jgi:hypothetical protein
VSTRRLTALVTALAVALLGAACGGGDSGGDGGGDASARKLLEGATRQTAKSADVNFELVADLKGVEELKGSVKLKLAGPFRSHGHGAMPDLDWKVDAEAAGQKIAARLITVPHNAFIEYEGTTYEVGEQLIERLTAQLKQNQADPKELRSLGLDASKWIKDPEVSDEEVDGVATKRVSGDVDVRKVLEGFNKLFASPSVSGRLPQGAATPSMSKKTIDELVDAVDKAHVETDVGRDDGIMRRSSAEISFEVPGDKRARLNGLKGGEVRMLFEQSDVNGDQQVTAPSGAQPIEELLRAIGIPPEVLLGPGYTTPTPG